MNLNKYQIISILDKVIYLFLALFTLTFYLDVPINFFVAACVCCIIKYFIVRPEIKLYSKHIYIILFFLGTTLISLLFSTGDQPILVALKAYKSMFISPLTGFIILFGFKLTKKRAIVLLTGMAISFNINALAAIYQFMNLKLINPEFPYRIIGFYSSLMLMSGIELLILPIILVMIIYNTSLNKTIKMFFIFTILLNIPAVILAETRIIWISLAITYFLIFMFGIKKKIRIIPVILTVIIIATPIIMINPSIQHRFDTINNISTNVNTGYQSNRERLLMWKAAWQMYKDYPVFGVGMDNFYAMYNFHYKNPTAVETQWHAHNVLLNTMAQSGTVGTIGLLALFIYLYYDVIKTWRREKNIISIAYFFSLLAYSINLMTDTLFCGHNIKLPTYVFWFITGAYLSLNQYIVINNKLKL